MHEINKICHLKSSRSPLEDDAEKNFKNFGKFSFEHFIRSPARKWSILCTCGQFRTKGPLDDQITDLDSS